MRIALVSLFIAATCTFAQERPLTVDKDLPVPPLHFDSSGQLMINASATSSSTDFDYLLGKWKLRNSKLRCRLNGCTDWSPEFESFVENEKVLGGLGNIDKYYENVSGAPFYGLAVRLFDTKTRLWNIYWADGRGNVLDAPVTGSFDHGVGHFFGRDTYKGKKIILLFRWDVRNPLLPVWSQAFSADEGKTWEWNSINISERIF